MGRAERALSGVAFGMLAQVLMLVVGIWLTPLLLDRLGTHQYGLWLVATQILGYLALLDLGVVALVPREVAFTSGQADGSARRARLTSLMGTVRSIVYRQAIVVAGVAGAVWLLLPSEWSELRTPLALVLLGFVACFPFRIYQAALQGLQQLGFLGRVHILSWSVSTLLTVSIILWRPHLLALAASWLVTQFLSAVVCRARLRKLEPALFERVEVRESTHRTGWLRRSLWVSVSQLSQVFLSGSDLLLVGKLFGPSAAVTYGCTAKLIQVFQNYPTLLISSAAPALSELRGQGDIQRVLQVCKTLAQAMLIASGLIAAVVLASNSAFVTWWVGEAQLAPTAVTLTLTGVMVLRHWNVTYSYSIFSLGDEKHVSLTGLLDGVTGLVAGWVFSHWLGLVGIALGGLVGVALFSLPLNLRAFRRLTQATILGQLAAIWPWGWRFAITATVAAWVAPAWPLEGLLGTVTSAATVAVLYLAVIAPLAFRPPLRPYVDRLLAKFIAVLRSRRPGNAGASSSAAPPS